MNNLMMSRKPGLLRVIETRTEPFDAGIEQALVRSLDFRLYEAATTFRRGAHTTGWRKLPFAVFTYGLSAGFNCVLRDGVTLRAYRGEAFLLPSGVEHRMDVEREKGERATWMHAVFTIHEGIDVLSLVDLPYVLPHKVAHAAMLLCRDLIALYYDPPEGMLPLQLMARKKRAVYAFLDTVLTVATPRANYGRVMEASQRVAPALQMIQDVFNEPLTHARLAAAVHLSPSRFHEVFREATGLTPIQYLLRRRLRAAQAMLLRGDDTLATIAERCGFADAFHLSRTFKRHFGESPRAFRAARG